MSDDRWNNVMNRLRQDYNTPPPTPRKEMWSEIQARLEPRGAKGGAPVEGPEGDGSVVSIAGARTKRGIRSHHPLRWAAAAAAVLVVGVGIGRVTAPAPGPLSTGGGVAARTPDSDALKMVAVEHLTRTESLLTMVRADARSGRLDPAVVSWARSLLGETRLLMDARSGGDPVMGQLLEDLELVLAQIVGVAGAEDGDQDRLRSELTLALDGMERRDVLPRIQAVIPAGPGFAGT